MGAYKRKCPICRRDLQAVQGRAECRRCGLSLHAIYRLRALLVREAVATLRGVSAELRGVGARSAARAVQRAIKSADGALRHAEGCAGWFATERGAR